MDLKEKLDIIWKYSILVVILFSLICFHSNWGKSCGYGQHCKAYSGQCVRDSGDSGKMDDMKKMEEKVKE
ncbi:hypothetical protein ACFL6E_03450 [Candidatus Neomarinimicrobiota bacterium]